MDKVDLEKLAPSDRLLVKQLTGMANVAELLQVTPAAEILHDAQYRLAVLAAEYARGAMRLNPDTPPSTENQPDDPGTPFKLRAIVAEIDNHRPLQISGHLVWLIRNTCLHAAEELAAAAGSSMAWDAAHRYAKELLAVRQLHQERHFMCRECTSPWPCPTARAIGAGQ